MKNPVLTLCLLLSATAAQAQAQTPSQAPTPAAAPPAATSTATSLGMVVFPAKSQAPQQQAQDEGECYAWSKGQTGVDPMAPPPAATQPTVQKAPPATGSRLKGAARGAAAGAVIGEVANGDAGDGAAIGATAGVGRSLPKGVRYRGAVVAGLRIRRIFTRQSHAGSSSSVSN
jgi:hypothetical protein